MPVADMVQHHILCSRGAFQAFVVVDDADLEPVGEGYDATCQLAL